MDRRPHAVASPWLFDSKTPLPVPQDLHMLMFAPLRLRIAGRPGAQEDECVCLFFSSTPHTSVPKPRCQTPTPRYAHTQ